MKFLNFQSQKSALAARRKPRPLIPEAAVRPDEVMPARVENFPEAGPVPWLDRPDARKNIRRALSKGRITPAEADHCYQWHEHGYLILPSFFTSEELDGAWLEYERNISEGKLSPGEDHGQGDPDDKLPGRTLNPHFKVEGFRALLKSPRMLELLGILMGVKARPFQTIAGHKGSQQLAHSDSIHMTTYPLGYLAANWIAFEDIHPDCGPLEYYPDSHRLPYAYSKDVGITLEEGNLGYASYHEKYEPHVQSAISKNGLKVQHFQAKKGDVLIWHANLLHGGSMRKNMNFSRKALVCHYFADGCICYHDYTGTISRLHLSKPGSSE